MKAPAPNLVLAALIAGIVATNLLSILPQARAFQAAVPPAAAPRPRSPAALTPNSRELFTDFMRIADRNQDPATHFVSYPRANHTGSLIVRETSWYALGLLLRDAPEDRAHAAACLEAVLGQQYLDPAAKWYGTFRRTPTEPLPPSDARDFDQFDPNWRVFVGTTFQIILADYSDRIPPALATRLYQSIDIALTGERQEGRLKPSYTNISLMYGALWDFASAHHHDPAQQAQAAAWNESVYALFKQHDAFNEYNSPTYYGVDLLGLALWRTYGSTPRIRTMGASMEATLWSDIADFYQPGLRNIAGPYDRSYGMDMETYTAVTGLWIRTLLPASKAPLPPLDPTLDHSLDDWFTPIPVVLGANPPAAALAKFQHFAGPHLVTRPITDQRTATAWVGEGVLFGGESTHQTVGVNARSQFHAATIQWRTPSGPIGWIYITRTPPIDATASRQGISIQTSGDVTLRIHAPGLKPSDLTATHWTLPGLSLDVTTDATNPTFTPYPEFTDVTYLGVHQMTITRKP